MYGNLGEGIRALMLFGVIGIIATVAGLGYGVYWIATHVTINF